MVEYIEREALDRELQNLVREYNRKCEMDKSAGAFESLYRLRLALTADVVSREVFEQVKWERDTALKTLEKHGIGLGQKVADVVEVVRCKDCEYRYVPCHCALWYGTVGEKEYFIERGDDFSCSYGKRKEGAEE